MVFHETAQRVDGGIYKRWVILRLARLELGDLVLQVALGKLVLGLVQLQKHRLVVLDGLGQSGPALRFPGGNVGSFFLVTRGAALE